jgi:hypothetical protein
MVLILDITIQNHRVNSTVVGLHTTTQVITGVILRVPVGVQFVKCTGVHDVDGDVAEVKVWKRILSESVIDCVTQGTILNTGERKW